MIRYPCPRRPDVVALLPEGRLDALGSPLLDHELAALHAAGHTRIVLNLCHATYISSSALRTILLYARKLRQAQGDLKLCCPSDKVARVLTIAGFDAILGIFPDEESASQAFPGSQSDSSGTGG